MAPGSPYDDVLLAGCHYMWALKTYNEQFNSTFESVYGEVVPVFKDALGRAFNLDNDTMNGFTFALASGLMDFTVSENFEGVPPRYRYTPDQFQYLKFVQKLWLTIPTSDYARQLVITKELRRPIAAIKAAMDALLAGRKPDLKYMIYSSHDDAVANTMLFLKPVDAFFFDIPFASTIVLELHYNDSCLAKDPKNRACFTVKAFYNNKPLKFQTCLDENRQRGSQSDFCLADDFFAHWDSVRYLGDVD